jgi:pyruvate/2-oxoglutarate/acetoin dehydrogenase E1 component
MALRGLHPVVEIMFGDFLSLAADQLINHIAKFRWMYNDQVRLPLVIRTPMGGRRGYGPTHSQSLEKFFLGIPGLRVLAPTALSTPGYGPGDLLYRTILESEDPVLFIENKLLYLLPVQSAGTLMDFNLTTLPAASERAAPAYSLTIRGAPPPTLTLAVYGYMADLARQAVLRLAYDHEIFTELIILTLLAPFDVEPIIASVKRTSRLLVVEEGTLSLGWGAEILARASEALGQRPMHLRRLAARDLPIPASGPLEAAVLPDEEAIITVARSMA